jgi:hypothetical protein
MQLEICRVNSDIKTSGRTNEHELPTMHLFHEVVVHTCFKAGSTLHYEDLQGGQNFCCINLPLSLSLLLSLLPVPVGG